jgi:hypothetical protein
MVDLNTVEEPKTNETIDLRFMNNDFRVFRATPSFKDPTNYLEWLNKIEKTKAQNWKDMGIYDLIMLSKVGLEYIVHPYWFLHCISGITHITTSTFHVA